MIQLYFIHGRQSTVFLFSVQLVEFLCTQFRYKVCTTKNETMRSSWVFDLRFSKKHSSSSLTVRAMKDSGRTRVRFVPGRSRVFNLRLSKSDSKSLLTVLAIEDSLSTLTDPMRLVISSNEPVGLFPKRLESEEEYVAFDA